MITNILLLSSSIENSDNLILILVIVIFTRCFPQSLHFSVEACFFILVKVYKYHINHK